VSDPQPPFVLGIDAGGTKTVCFLADGTGALLSEGRAGGANLQTDGELQLEKVIHRLMEETIGDRMVAPSSICLGIAGVDRADEATIVQDVMRRVGYKARVVITNDALVALVAGVGHEAGVVIVAGTGSIAYGRNHDNVAARAGGWGYVLGDEGSGYWIGRRALRAVVRHADGRGPVTRLTPRVLEHYDVARPADLIQEIYHRSLRPPDIAALAGQVQAACTEGDAVAAGILEGAARELLDSAASVVGQLGMTNSAFMFVLAGGVFRAVPWLVETLRTRLPALAPAARVKVLEREPAWGAVLIALAEARGERRIPVYKES
jgi:N-acetylglucosamine kinase